MRTDFTTSQRSSRSGPIAIYLTLAAVATATLFLLGRSHPVLGIAMLFLSGFFVYGPHERNSIDD